MASLKDIVAFCDERTRQKEFKDFNGAFNGLQVENDGTVSKIGASVDAGIEPFRLAREAGIDFLICHHGLFWNPPTPLTGSNFQKVKLAMDSNLAVYGSHLPLDAHPEIGNSAILAEQIDLDPIDSFLPYEGINIGLITRPKTSWNHSREKLKALFPDTYTAMEYGSVEPEAVAICTGSGASAVGNLPSGINTLITGELRQHHFNMAQELALNLYPCGHYATEVFGVKALAAELAKAFNLDWVFVDTPCPL